MFQARATRGSIVRNRKGVFAKPLQTVRAEGCAKPLSKHELPFDRLRANVASANNTFGNTL